MKIIRSYIYSAVMMAVIGSALAPLIASAATPKPVINSITMTKGVYKTVVNKKNMTFNPFPGYTGKIWAKRVYFGKNLGSTYLFIQTATNTTGQLKYYNTNVGELRSLTLFYGKNYAGYNTSIIVQPTTGRVFIAFGTKAVGASALVKEINRKQIVVVNSPVVADTSAKGQVLVKFLKIYTNEYGLATMIADKPATLMVWRFSTKKNSFLEDTTFDKSVIKTANNVISL